MPLDTNLHKKAYGGDLGPAEDLIAEGEDVNVRGAQNRTAIQRAAGAGHTEMVKLLISKGANPNLLDDSGRTTLHWAALHGTVGVADAIKACAEFPCDVNAKTKVGATALHMAAEGGKVEFMQWLLANKADVLAKDGSTPEGGKTAWELAKEKQMEPVMALLKAAGGASVEAAGGCCIVS